MSIYTTPIINRKEIALDTLEVSFRRPEGFSFRAGQYVQVAVPRLLFGDAKGASRLFSIASSPLEQAKLSIAFRMTGSGFKRTLENLPMKSMVSIEGPHGFFTLPEADEPLVIIAGGIGITAYLGMVQVAAKQRPGLPITLLYANKTRNRVAYLKELEALAVSNKHFELKTITGSIDEQDIWECAEAQPDCRWHIAGPPAMVDYVRNILILLDVPEGRIYHEHFIGY